MEGGGGLTSKYSHSNHQEKHQKEFKENTSNVTEKNPNADWEIWPLSLVID